MKDAFSLPNQITYFRIILIPVFVAFLLMNFPYKDLIAALFFIILSLSDALDGYVARKKRQMTNIGKIIDPIADKLLISAALIFLIGRIQLWMAVIIIVRELVITVARLFFIPKGVIISASNLGKLKTISQIVAIVAVILNLPFTWWFTFTWWLMLAAVIVTVVSGFDYLVKMGKLMGENVLTLPNIITTFRLLLIPLFIINLIKLNINFALLIFTIIVLSDKLDGISARITQQMTKFGRIFDAFTDTVLIVASYVAFFAAGFLEFFWIVIFSIPILIIVTSKMVYYSRFKQIPPYALGKVVIGIAYVGVIAITINFVYKSQILILGAALAYIYMIADVYRNVKN